jgi:hypothetical protein
LEAQGSNDGTRVGMIDSSKGIPLGRLHCRDGTALALSHFLSFFCFWVRFPPRSWARLLKCQTSKRTCTQQNLEILPPRSLVSHASIPRSIPGSHCTCRLSEGAKRRKEGGLPPSASEAAGSGHSPRRSAGGLSADGRKTWLALGLRWGPALIRPQRWQAIRCLRLARGYQVEQAPCGHSG